MLNESEWSHRFWRNYNVGYNYYPKTRIFIRHLIKLCLFCPITVTRRTSNVLLSHIGLAQYRPVSSPKNSVATLSINHTQNWDPSRLSPSPRVSSTWGSSHFISQRFLIGQWEGPHYQRCGMRFLRSRGRLRPWAVWTGKRSARVWHWIVRDARGFRNISGGVCFIVNF